MTVGGRWKLCALCFLREQSTNACFARATDPCPSGWMFDFPKFTELRSCCCAQPRATNASAGAAVLGEISSIHGAAAIL